VVRGAGGDALRHGEGAGAIPLPRSGFGGGPTGNLYAEVSDVDALGALMSSLDRPGLDRVDVVYVHDPDSHEELGVRTAAEMRAAVFPSPVPDALWDDLREDGSLAS
jgi:hypothetical protein